MMDYEWDWRKSRDNETKHGVSFMYAIDIWLNWVLTMPSRRKGENRKLSIGVIAGEYWTVIGESKGESRRIISARRSTIKEMARYDRNNI